MSTTTIRVACVGSALLCALLVSRAATAEQGPAPALELRDDSARLQLNATRHRALAERLLRLARGAKIDVRSVCPLAGCSGDRLPRLSAIVIAEGPNCRLGVLERQGGSRFERALSPPFDCLASRVTDAAGDLITILFGRRYQRSPKKGAPIEVVEPRAADAVLSAGRRRLAGRSAHRALTVAAPTKRRVRLRVSALFQLLSRNFVDGSAGTSGSRSYASGLESAVGLAAEVYPHAWSPRSAWAGLGVGLRYVRTLGVTAVYMDAFNMATADAALWQFDLDVRYRLQTSRHRYAPDIVFSFGLGWQSFEIEGNNLPMPNVQFTYLRFGLGDIEQPLFAGRNFGLSVRGQLALMLVTDAGDLESANAVDEMTGLDLGLALRARLYGVFGEIGVGYRRMAVALDYAGTAVDEVVHVMAQVGYAL